jgi:hypothetical protein
MSSLHAPALATAPTPTGLPAIQLPLKINMPAGNGTGMVAAVNNPQTSDRFTRQTLMNPRVMGGNQRSCLTSLLEMFSWGAMFSLSDSLIDSLLRVLGHVFGNFGDVLGSIF